MVFRITFDGESVVCSSPRCIQKLLEQGWQLADPEQAGDLTRALEAEGRPGTAETPQEPNWA